MGWTAEQIQAIEDAGNDLLVSAGAGAGKTSVMTSRIVRLLEEGEDIDSILVVTFTNAAAAQMKERIRISVSEAIEKAKGEKREHLIKQLLSLPGADINTVHSACISILRRYFNYVGIDPEFEVLGNIGKQLQKRSMEELLETEYEKGDELFYGLAERFAYKGDYSLEDIIMDLNDFFKCRPYPKAWAEDALRFYHRDTCAIYADITGGEEYGQLVDTVTSALDRIVSALALVDRDAYKKLYGILLQDAENFESILNYIELKDFSAAASGISGIKYAAFDSKLCAQDEKLRDTVKGLRDSGKKILKSALKNFLLTIDPQQMASDINEMAPYLERLFESVFLYQKIYSKHKLQRNALDFNDLEHYTLQALENDEVRRACKQQYKYIFIDEYQDFNAVQEEIVSNIAGTGNVFMVGDIKQSIYRFRQSDPNIFLKKYKSFPKKAESNQLRIDLNKNFRSSNDIVAFINYIFRNLLARGADGVTYGPDEELVCGKDDMPHVPIEFHLINTAVKNGDEEASLYQTEARLAVKTVKKLLSQGYKLGDIAILVRSIKNYGDFFVQELAVNGLACISSEDKGFSDPQVEVFLNLLRLIDNRLQDIPLVSVLFSPICGFSTEEIANIRLCKDGFFHEALREYINQDNDTAKKASAFWISLERWKSISKFIDLKDFILLVLNESGYLDHVLMNDNGAQLAEGLYHIANSAFDPSAAGGTLHSFLERYTEQLQNGDDGPAPLTQGNDLIRLMTIHKSKGLEFPVVIIPGMGKKMNTNDLNKTVLLHSQLGIGTKHIDLKLRTKRDTIMRQRIRTRLAAENTAEELRVLYVAMTRAMERLIISGTFSAESSTTMNRWLQEPTPENQMDAVTYLDLLCPAIIRHRDGKALRELAGNDLPVTGDGSKFDLTIHDMAGIDGSIDIVETAADCGYIPETLWVEERFAYIYPHRSGGIVSKMSITELIRRREKRETSARIKHSSQAADGVDALSKGTAMHTYLMHADLSIKDKDQIKAFALTLCKRNILSTKTLDLLDYGQLEAFLNSDIANDMRDSELLLREMPFHLSVRASDIEKNWDDNESVLLQGIIDCCFLKGGEWVILDYKTDRLDKNDAETAKKRHSTQIEMYSRALREITGKNVSGKYIYLLTPGMLIEL